MKKMRKNRVLALLLTLMMVIGMLPTTALAAHDGTGRPTDLAGRVTLAIYNKSGFPGEPAIYGVSDYTKINSNFKEASFWNGYFNNRASNVLTADILNVLEEGAHDGNVRVWGYYDPEGASEFFTQNSGLLKQSNEETIIKTIKGSNVNVDDYEIIWYVIKYQTNDGWHIDGVIKETEKYTVHYYGNGNTSGEAPTGVTNIVPGGSYTVLGNTGGMVKELNGVHCEFLGWNDQADGNGKWYKAGDTITDINNDIALYAQWKTTVTYTATVNTYLDRVKVNAADIHGETMDLYLSADGGTTVIKLDRVETGTYTAEVENGNYRLYHMHDGADHYEQVGNFQLTIYNQNGSLDMNHYTVRYDAAGGVWAEGEQPEVEGYAAMNPVTAITQTPTKDGYLFLGWKDQAGNDVQPGGVVTTAIAEPYVITAQWEKAVDVTVNVIINHDAAAGGYDIEPEKDELTVALVYRPDENTAYLETGHVVNFSNNGVNGYDYYADGIKGKPANESEVRVSEYKATAPTVTGVSGSAEYTVVTSKSGYDVKSVTPTKDENGNWTIDVVLEFDPSNFDLTFTVGVEKDLAQKHPSFVPKAAIVKVACWNEDKWQIITQQDGGQPGVRVDIDPTTLLGSGSYPVWMTGSDNDPYGYRIVVTAFVYPNDTIVAANKTNDGITFTDGNYTATVEDVTGGKQYGNGLDGAYYADNVQNGKLHAQIDMELYDVTFNAMGGKVNGKTTQTVNDLLVVPGFEDYKPTREAGYVFEGWYKDEKCTIPAVENEWLTADVTLYAKWSHLLTIQGTVTIEGTYGENNVQVNKEDRPSEALVVLQRYDSTGVAQDVTSQVVKFDEYTTRGSATYSFTDIRDEGRTYRILVMEHNYITAYDNESDSDAVFTAGEHDAVYGNDFVAVVNADLTFEPESADLILNVDARAISEGFRPKDVLAEVLYRDTGTTNSYKRIAQHNVDPNGVAIALPDGTGDGSELVWKYHYDAAPYAYQMNVSEVDDVIYNSDDAPFSISYDPAVRWDNANERYTGELKATLVPKTYEVVFDLQVEPGEKVGQMNTKVAKDPQTEEFLYYYVDHTWSYDTVIDVHPVRDGYLFKGWVAEKTGVYADDEIDATVAEDVVLVAQWEATGIEYYNNYAYIFGYNDTTMAPEEPLLRSEVCAMIHRLAKQAGSLNGFKYDESKEAVYADIDGQWHRSGIEFLYHMGGFAPAENIYPDVPVTRGEAFELVCIGLSFTKDTTLTDDEYAEILREAGFISGDGTGNLMVDSTLQRAEFCAIYNKIIGRAVAGLETADGTVVTAEHYGYTDIPADKWYYKTMIRATSAYDEDGYIALNLRGVRNELDDYNG